MGKYPGFVGPSYSLRSPNVECQRTLNLFVEQNEIGTGKDDDVLTLVSTPGLKLFATTGNGPIRAAFETSTERVFIVSGPSLYELFSDGTTSALLGTLNTSEGFVSLADNGVQLMLVDGTGYILTLSNNTFTAITDPDFPTADFVAFVDGYFLVNQRGTRNIYFSALYDGTSWDGLDFFAKEGAPDFVRCLLANKGKLWVFGDLTMEVFYNSGDALNPIQRMPGVFLENGIAAAATAKVLDGSPYWVGQDRDGRVGVFRANGYTPERVSTYGVEQAISGYGDISGATAWKYQEDGHHFYLLNFVGAKTTWCLDTATGMWHEREFASENIGTLIVFQQDLTVDSPAVPWRVDSGKNAAHLYDGGSDYGSDPQVEAPATMSVPAIVQTGDILKLTTVAETSGGIPIASGYTSNADGTFGTGGAASQYDGPPHSTSLVTMLVSDIDVAASPSNTNYNGGFLQYVSGDDSIIYSCGDGHIRKFDCLTETVIANVDVTFGSVTATSNVSGGKFILRFGTGKCEQWSAVSLTKLNTYNSGTFSSDPTPASNIEYHEPSDNMWMTEGSGGSYAIFKYNLGGATRTAISGAPMVAAGWVKLSPAPAVTSLYYADGVTIGFVSTSTNAGIATGTMNFAVSGCGGVFAGPLSVDNEGYLWFGCDGHNFSGHAFKYDPLSLTELGHVGHHNNSLNIRPTTTDGVPVGIESVCFAQNSVKPFMLVGADLYWDIALIDTTNVTVQANNATTPSLFANGNGLNANLTHTAGVVASATAMWSFCNTFGSATILRITKIVIREGSVYPDHYLSQQYGVGALIGTFTDNSDEIVGSPFYVGYGTSLTSVPTGATKISLGINDIFFQDNYNAGVKGTYTVQVTVARSITTLGSLQRHRGQDHVFAFNKHLIGDYENGSIYEMSRDFLTDSGVNITRERTAPHLGNNGQLVFHNKFQVDMEMGVGPTPPLLDGNGNEREPQAMIQWSDDGGKSWSNEHWVDIGKAGEYRTRAILRRLGRTRDRVYRFKVTDPVGVTILAAWLDVEAGA